MGRPASARAMDVWMNGVRVGRWTVRRGDHRFEYADSWLGAAEARPLSLSMPLRPSGAPYRTDVVQPFFDNLLPDSDELRRRLMTRFGTHSTSAFDLLEEIGRDCVGAVQLLPADAPPPMVRAIRGRKLDDAEVGGDLSRLQGPPLGQDDDEEFRLSLAGAQEKTAFLRHEGAWCVPEGTTPTTHIFKPPISSETVDLSGSVENEWLCGQLLRGYGVPCAVSEMASFAGQRVLVVERFDRELSADGSWIMRLPQEDFCQATGTPPGLKYESEGGPASGEIIELLRGSSQVSDRVDFFRTQFIFWLLCAIDGHAKNFSLFIEAGGASASPRDTTFSPRTPSSVAGRTSSPRTRSRWPWPCSGRTGTTGGRRFRAGTGWKPPIAAVSRGGGVRRWSGSWRRPRVIAQVREGLPASFPERIAETILDGLARAAEAAKAGLRRPGPG